MEIAGLTSPSAVLQSVYGTPLDFWSPREIFSSLSNHKYNDAYFKYTLTAEEAAQLLGVTAFTIRAWSRAEKLKFRWDDKRRRRLYSLKHLADAIDQQVPRNFKGSLHCRWTPQEKAQLLRGEIPEGRNGQACQNMRHRLRKTHE